MFALFEMTHDNIMLPALPLHPCPFPLHRVTSLSLYQPGKISRKIGKAASDVIFATVRKGREINSKYKLSDKVCMGACLCVGRGGGAIRACLPTPFLPTPFE